MKRLTRCWHALRHVGFVAALVVVGTVMLAGGAGSASATGPFNCETRSSEGSTCYVVSGANESMEEGEGDDYTRAEFELVFWKYNGGSNYTDLYSHLFYSYTGIHCYSSGFEGHEEVSGVGHKGNLAGYQISGCRA
jgi:hypothetical protein